MRERLVYEFADVRVDVGRMAALRGGVAIPLEPKAFDVLIHLIEHRDRVVTKEELLDAVWPGTFVTPNVLTRAVAQIRKALGDESQDARLIETIAKRGYRFIPPVTVVPAGEPAPESPSTAPLPVEAAAAPSAAASIRRRWIWAAALAIVALSLAAAMMVRGRITTAGPAASRTDVPLNRLTNRRGFTGMPALSPDGRSVVYSSDASGALELYMISLAPGSAEVALTRDGGHNTQPAWSPDGQWIAFHSAQRGGVWVIPSSGGVARQVVEFGSDPAWSPDSSTLVFTSDASGFAGQSALWTVDRDGGNRRALTHVGQPPGGHRAPSWSHDGRHIAFVVTRGGWRVAVMTLDVATGQQHHIDTTANAADPVFAADDRALMWGGSTPTGNGRIFKHAIDAAGAPVGTTETIVPMEGGIVDGLSLASNGTLVFAARTVDANLWATDVGPDGRASDPVRLTDEVSRLTHPDTAPDGRIAYLQTAIGAPPSVWIMRADGSAREAVTAGFAASDPNWDRTSPRLMVFGGNPDARAEPVWIDLASRRRTPLGVPSTDMYLPRLSPDARTLVFHRIEKDGVLSVWTMTMDGVEKKIATDREAVSYPTWSPDGESVAVEIKRGDSTHIGWVPRQGGPVVQLTDARGQSWPHSWAPDNDRIAFAGQRGGVWNVYTVSRRTREVSQLTFFKSAAGYVRYPSWSPAGSRIVFERAINTANVWMASLGAAAQ